MIQVLSLEAINLINWTNLSKEIIILEIPENIVAGPLGHSVDVLAPDAYLKPHVKVVTRYSAELRNVTDMAD